MFLKSGDLFHHPEELTSDKIRHILDLLDGYMAKPYNILEIREDSLLDINNRIDVEIEYIDDWSKIRQKLLILNDEVIDGATFHKRYNEWY